MLLFLPQIIKQLGLTNMQVGWVTMIPYLCAVVAMLTWGWVSDRLSERRWTLSLACLISAAGLVNRRAKSWHGLGTGRHVDCRDGFLWLQGAVLGRSHQ